jgi:transcriptional antiterminator NusG
MTEYQDKLYVLWVKTRAEETAAREIRLVFGDEVSRRQFLVETFFRKQGSVKKEIRSAFPGYLFLSSGLQDNEFLVRAQKAARQSMHILKALRYGDGYEAAMRQEERAAIDLIWQGRDCLGASNAMAVGQQVVITDGPFVGRESIIKEIHTRRREAIVEIEFMGGVRRATIGLDIIKRVQLPER